MPRGSWCLASSANQPNGVSVETLYAKLHREHYPLLKRDRNENHFKFSSGVSVTVKVGLTVGLSEH